MPEDYVRVNIGVMQHQTRVIIALGTAQTFAWGSTYYLPAILANPMAAELGVGTPTVFVAFSLGLLLSAFIGPGSGRLIDLHGGHRVLPASNLLIAAGLAMLGSSTGALTLTASWLVIGAGMSAGLYEAAFSTLARIFGASARRAITGITLIAGFASTVCWPLSGWMDSAFGWRATCYVWAAVQLFVCLPINVMLPRTRAAEHAAPKEPVAAGGGPRHAWLMAAMAFVFAGTWFSSTAMAAHLPRLLQEAGATHAGAIAAGALIGPAQVAARLVEASLMRHFSPLASARVATLAHPLAAGGLVAFGAPATTFFALTHGAGNGVMTIANGTLPLYLLGAGGYGFRQGLMMAPARFVQAASPFIFDLALSRYGTGALALTAGFALCSFVVLLLIPSRRS
ncbi:MAG: MFS transporter [Betaproteobacteria bacterium]